LRSSVVPQPRHFRDRIDSAIIAQRLALCKITLSMIDLPGVARVEQLAGKNGRWTVEEAMSGDQSDQGRELLMDAHTFQLYRVRLCTYPRH